MFHFYSILFPYSFGFSVSPRFFGLWPPICSTVSNNKIYFLIINFNKNDNLIENNKMKFSFMKILNG
jgi:hypothetical protein